MKDILNGSLEPSDAHLLFGEKLNPSGPLIASVSDGDSEPKKEEKEEKKSEGETPVLPNGLEDVVFIPSSKEVAKNTVSWGDEEDESEDTTQNNDSSSTSWLNPLIGKWK